MSMKDIRIGKLILNMGAGKDHDKLEKGIKLFEHLSDGLKPVKTKTTKRIAQWGLRPGLPIGCKLTVRGEKAMEMVARLIGAKDNILSERQFDDHGNIAFGIAEYIDIPGIEYMPEIGIIGFQVCIALERPGFSIQRRRLHRAKLGAHHKITRQEAIDFMKKNFNIKLAGEVNDDE